MTRKGLTWVVLSGLSFAVIVGGCGGSSSRNGRLALSVMFGPDSRALPQTARSVTVSVLDLGLAPLVEDILVVRTAAGEPARALVTGIRPGLCVVRARGYLTDDGSGQMIAWAETQVLVESGRTTPVELVTEALAVTVEVRPTQVFLSYPPGQWVGNIAQLAATTRDADGNIVLGNLEWRSSDDMVAIVDSNGLVTANGAGAAVITARDARSGAKGFCSVYVNTTQ